MLPVGFWFQPQASSAEVEMTAYVLLAYLTIQPTPDEEDLTTAMLIIRWLTKQQNSNGGFSSTQVRDWPEPLISPSVGERFTNSKHTHENKRPEMA